MLNFLKDQFNDLASKYIDKQQHQYVTLDMVRAALSKQDQASLNKVFFDLIDEEEIKTLEKLEKDNIQADGNPKSEQEFGEKSLKIFQQSKLRMSKEQQEEKFKEEQEKQLKEALRSIDKAYVLEKTKEEEIMKLEFNKFPKILPLEEVEKREQVLNNWSNIIGVKLNENCMKHYDNIEQGFKLIDQIYKVNSNQIQSIQNTRKTLQSTKQHLVTSTNHIISLKKRIQRTKEVLDQLNLMQKQFGELNNKIKDIENEDCLQDAHTVIPKLNQAKQQIMEDKNNDNDENNLLKKYKCLQNIEQFIEDKIELFKKCIQSSAEKIIFNYTPSKYFTIMHSYFYLQKHFCDEIKPYSLLFTSNIHLYVDQIVRYAFDQFKEDVGFYVSEYDERRFNISYLLPSIQKDQFLTFCRILLHKYCDFMSCYSNCLAFHLQLNPDQNQDFINKVDNEEKQEFLEFLEQVKNLYIKNKEVYWIEIQRKIGLIIQPSSQIQSFSHQMIRQFLEYINIFLGIGESFSNSPSHQLQNFISDKCEAYIDHYHHIAQVAVISTLQSENWKRLPITQGVNYSFIDKGEVKSIHRILRVMKNYSFKPLDLNDNVKDVFEYNLNTFKTDNPFQVEIKKETDVSNKQRSASYFRKFNKKYNIMNHSRENGEESQIKSNSNIIQNQEGACNFDMKQIFEQKQYPKQQIVISSSSQKLMNSFEEYLELIDTVRPATPQIIKCIKQNLNFYIYYIVNSFLDNSIQAQLMEKLALQGVHKLDDPNQLENNISKFSQVNNSLKLQKKHKNLAKVYLENNVSCYQTIKKLIPPSQLQSKQFKGISERIIAIESFDYLLFIYRSLIPIIQYMYDKTFDQFEVDYYESIYNELKSLIFVDYAPQFARSDQIFSAIPNSKWELSSQEVGQTSNYVERFCQIIVDYKEQLRSTGGGSVPEQVQEEIFCLLIDFCYKELIEAYSKIKKINEFGRLQMQRDFQMIQKKVQSLSKNQTREQLQRAFVEAYLKICQSQDIEEVQTFINTNKERYSLEALIGLIRISAAGSNIVVKTKQKDQILTILNDYKKYFLENNIDVPF
ncbi:coiled-coil protein, putative (macronuclear) [Tetrahymena thermophila SB210]|uniref:Coiled-coil protein, putative n=1 Tax=Tetrahymena thermophila (strain SB210) TaxID=312017 RepID=Q23RV5_TETTS|nr:coiled-coil protein, putative [Tetrahymena thermophila SB210]EAR99284.2 coiled-coil protein, putative [Tetrahymena thermophila SB210]|eukprot:XP_001019529.2 coiled-coil protein, putative [Tetrahymena thermophila SB210]